MCFSDPEGSEVNPLIYITDNDSGNRVNQNGNDNTADKIYNVQTVNGAASFEVINGIVNVLNGVNGSVVDKRFVDNTATAKFIGYDLSIAETNVSLLGNGTADTQWIMLKDALVYEANKAIVDAYTSINSANAFYDYAKAYLVDNYAGENETIVVRSSDTIDAGDYDVVIDSSASSVFAFDGSTITIKSSLFTGNITTTGVVTHNDLVNGSITDANGTVITLTAANASTFSSYVTVKDASDNVTDLGWLAETTSRTITIPQGGSISYYIIAFGFDALIVSDTDSEFNPILAANANVDTSLDLATTQSIAANIYTSVVGADIVMNVSADLRQYTALQVLTAINYDLYANSPNTAAALLNAGSTDGFGFTGSGVFIASPNFYGKVDDAVTTVDDYGIFIPVTIEVREPALSTSGYTPIRKNTSNLVLQYAQWSRVSADLDRTTIDSLRDGLAQEASVQSISVQTTEILEDTSLTIPEEIAGTRAVNHTYTVRA